MSETNNSKWDNMAEHCFDLSMTEWDLFDEVCKILGSNTDNCLDDGFEFPCSDTFWDYYDGSVEIVRKADKTRMTREQADAVLALGFDRIYESIGDAGWYWTKHDVQPCRARGGDRRAEREAILRKRMEKLNDSICIHHTDAEREALMKSCPICQLLKQGAT